MPRNLARLAVAAGPRQRRGGSAGRWRRALSRAEGSRSPRIAGLASRLSTPNPSTPRPLPPCRRRSGFGCCKRAIDRFGHEGPAELGKVEALLAALDRAVAERKTPAGHISRNCSAKAETDPCRCAGQPDRRPDPRRTGAAAPPPGGMKRPDPSTVPAVSWPLRLGLNHLGKHRFQRHYLSGNLR